MGDMQRDYDAMIRANQIARLRQDEQERQSRAVLDDFVQMLTINGVPGLPIYSGTLESSPAKTFAGFTIKKQKIVNTLVFVGYGYVIDESDMATSKRFYVQGLGLISGNVRSLGRLKSDTPSNPVVIAGGPSSISSDDAIGYVSSWGGPSDARIHGWDSEYSKRALLIRASRYIESKRAY